MYSFIVSNILTLKLTTNKKKQKRNNKAKEMRKYIYKVILDVLKQIYFSRFPVSLPELFSNFLFPAFLCLCLFDFR